MTANAAKQNHYPVKTRELMNHHMDSTIWNDLTFRSDDVIIATYAKSGTTWVQQIVGQMILGPDPRIQVAKISPWLDLRVPPKDVKLAEVEAQEHRRLLKTHLPVDALVFSPLAKYLYIARDGRDVAWSLYNHHANANDTWYEVLNETPGRVGPPIDRPPNDIKQYWRCWSENDGFPLWSYWENIRSWWEIRDLPNVKLVHFENLKNDMQGEMEAIADFLGIEPSAEDWDQTNLYCSFDWMKAHAEQCAPLGGVFWDGGASTFINKGTNGRWKESLSEMESKTYEERAVRELGESAAYWLKSGKYIDA
ncbi:MAG: sulfotransferase domain-containing protein [Rhodothermales bacterium]|nr:sulfotransferase domain-containing protein [Rhodothermales bacterium]